MTRILLTNDDGLDAPGLLALARAMREMGEVTVFAPGQNQSASGHKKTLFNDIRIEETTLDGDIPAMKVFGSPADCIALASMGLMNNWPPSIIVSGINRGENLSQDVTYSGTVTAALEGVIHAIPSLAVSLSNHDANDVEDYAVAARMATQVVPYILKHGLPPFTILSLNVPKGDVKGLRLTRQGVRIFRDELEIDGDVVRIVGQPPTGVLEELGTDIWAIHNGYASLTPIQLDMTAYQLLADLAAWDIQIT